MTVKEIGICSLTGEQLERGWRCPDCDCGAERPVVVASGPSIPAPIVSKDFVSQR